jgi:hypothetical protein
MTGRNHGSAGLEAWASLEVAPWRRLALGGSALREGLAAAARLDPSIAIFDISDGIVAPPALQAERIAAGELGLVTSRAALTRDFLQAVVSEHQIGDALHLGVRMQDRGPELRDVPVFAFHKVRFEQTILLPDLDFLIFAFYAGEEYRDGLAFADKRPEAYFIGATTGGIVTMERIAAGTHERIRAARFFRDSPGVTFEISSVVQCDSDATRAEVEKLVPMPAGWRSWHDQFRHRYLLSMDGNGATWSRTAVALASNSALVKYASPSLLYYMHGLDPWVHFIPVRRDADVLGIIADAERTRERDADIAQAGRAFAERHFTREAVMDYTAALLREYADAVRTG